MYNKTHTLTLLLFFIGFRLLAQTSTPAVPEQVTFADMSIRFDADARALVQQDVNSLLANRQYWAAKLDRVALYFPMIESILISEGVPADFKYLAVQESSLTPDAVSSSSAVGYWQFKRETATDNGMRVDDAIDERKSITASTHGAGQYLKKNNAQFNNWVTSLYSYYLGASGITKLVPPDWPNAREITLDSRTDRYILRFFAHKIAIESALKYHQASNRFALVEYPGGGGKTIPAIAEELGVDEFELRKYNRWLLGETVPTDKEYVMAIPVLNDQINDVRQKIVKMGGRRTPTLVQNDVGFPVLRRVAVGSGGKNDPVLYEINGLPGIQAQAGDNAASLARKAKISLSSFLRYNDMDESDPILTGDVYYLAKKRKKAEVPYHTVRDGETIRSISQRYALRLKKLLRYNRIERGERLAVGRVMWLRERRPGNKPVEIINSPTQPVYDRTPSPATRDVTANSSVERGPARPVAGSDGIPRNPSERKLYQPKLVGGGITPNDGTSEPATVQRTEPTRPPRPSSPTSSSPMPSSSAPVSPSVPITSPTATSSPVTRPSTGSTSTRADGTQRIVIVRSQEATPSSPVQPTETGSQSTEPASRPASSATGRPLYPGAPTQPATTANTSPTSVGMMNEPTRPRSTKTPSTSEPTRRTTQSGEPVRRSDIPADRPVAGSYDGPREQQADGSLTVPSAKAPPRPAAPGSIKPEPRPAPADVPMSEPKTTPPAAPASVRPTPAVATAVDHSVTKHLVEPGQTYYSISKLYGLTVDELLAMNNRTMANVLEAGQQLTVKAPSADKPVQSSQKSSSTTTSSGVSYHTVAKGETMFRISKIYDVTVEQIQEWNNLTDTGVKEGQKLKIMKASGE